MAESSKIIDLLTASAWRPEPGDTLTGTVEGYDKYEHDEYGVSPVVIVKREDDGKYTKVYAIHSVLADTLNELKPQIGDRLTITYLGLVASNTRTDAKGNPVEYHSYVAFTGDGNMDRITTPPW